MKEKKIIVDQWLGPPKCLFTNKRTSFHANVPESSKRFMKLDTARHHLVIIASSP